MSRMSFNMEGGADTFKDDDGRTALMWAANRGDLVIVDFLLSRGANPNKEDSAKWHALLWAVTGRDLTVIERLLQTGANINHVTETGETALIIATQEDDCMKLVQLLLQHGADPNIQSEDGQAPLLICAGKGDFETSMLLIDNGADINLKNEEGFTPLLIAASAGHIALAEEFIKIGAIINCESKVAWDWDGNLGHGDEDNAVFEDGEDEEHEHLDDEEINHGINEIDNAADDDSIGDFDAWYFSNVNLKSGL